MSARHHIETHPASSGQLSVITFLNRHPHVVTPAAVEVRRVHTAEQNRRPVLPGRRELITAFAAALVDGRQGDTASIRPVTA